MFRLFGESMVGVPAEVLSNLVAVTTPVILAPPVPLIYLLLISKLPPSCGVVSSTTLDIPPPPPVAVISTDAIPLARVAVTPAPMKLIVPAVPTEEPSS